MHRFLALILVLYLVVGLTYAFATPIFEASDEIWHYPVVREISENHRLPVQDPAVKAAWAQEGSQPPLYYFVAALLTGWIDTSDYEANAIANPFPKIGVPGATDNLNLVAHPLDQNMSQGGTVLAVNLIRWLSLLIGATTVYLTYRLAQTVFPTRPQLPVLAAAFVAFNPMVLFINASINNDNLVMLLTTLALWLLTMDMNKGGQDMRWGQTLLMGIVVGLAAITKVSGAVLAPVVALGLLLTAYASPQTPSAARNGLYAIVLGRLVIFALTVSLVAGWWYLRNLWLYGEILGLQRMALIAGPRPSGFGLLDLWPEWRGFWYSFWGVFGAFNLLAPRWFYLLVGGLTLLAGSGLLVFLGRKVRRRQRVATWPIHLVLVTFLALTMLGVVRWTLLTTASQGRLLFGGIAAIAIYLAFGLLVWAPPKRQQLVVRALALSLAAVAALLPFLVIAPAYRPPATVAALPADATPLDIRFGDDIQLAGFRSQAATTAPGQTLPITLYWRTDRAIDRNYQLSLNGYGFDVANVIKLDTWPGGGLLPTTFWQPGQLYADPYQLAIDPAAASPALLSLNVAFNTDLLNPSANQSLPAFTAGQPAGNIFLNAGTVATPVKPSQEIEPPLARLEHGIRLDQYRLDRHPDHLELELQWSTGEAIPVDYQIFVHLVAANGQPVSQGDAPPRRGYWPTHLWRSGETISSEHTIPLPLDLPPGEYQLKVGMYDANSGLRPTAFDAAGAPWPENAIVIPESVELR